MPQNIIWIGSYPKSGNTWVRAFLESYFSIADKELSINEMSSITTSDMWSVWFDQSAGKPFVGENFEDWIYLRPKALRLIAQSTSGHCFVKTHSKIDRMCDIDLIMPEVTAAAIYIIRNPFDVAVSFAYHMNVSIDVSIDRMCNSNYINKKETGILEVLGRWDDHIKSWSKAHGLPHHIIRYEDMVDYPNSAFSELLDFLQVPVQQTKFLKSLDETSFEALQQQESIEGFSEKPPSMETFFRTGKHGGWVDVLTSAQVERLHVEFEQTIVEFFPEIGEQTSALVSNKLKIDID